MMEIRVKKEFELLFMFGRCPECNGKPDYGITNVARCSECGVSYHRNEHSRAAMHNKLAATLGINEQYFVVDESKNHQSLRCVKFMEKQKND